MLFRSTEIHFLFRNCLFRALSDQLYGTPEKHKQLRKQVVSFMRNHPEDFEPFHLDDESVSFEHHLDLLEQDGTFAGKNTQFQTHSRTVYLHSAYPFVRGQLMLLHI